MSAGNDFPFALRLDSPTALCLTLVLLLFSALLASPVRAEEPLIVRKNLFSPERKPPPPPAAPAKEKRFNPLPAKSFQLRGVIIDDQGGRALIKIPAALRKKSKQSSGRDCLWVRQSEKLGGYVVERIEPDCVVLVRGKSRYRLRLFEQGAAAPLYGAARKKNPLKPELPAIDQDNK